MPTIPPCTLSLILFLIIIGLTLLVLKLTPSIELPKQIPYGDEWLDYRDDLSYTRQNVSRETIDPNDTDECYWDTEAFEIALDRWNNPREGD